MPNSEQVERENAAPSRCNASFADYEPGFLEDLVPILPPDALIHPDSPSLESLLKGRGKVPGKKRRGGWNGFVDWTEYETVRDDLPIWQGWGAGIGLQGRRFPGLDIDVLDPLLADAIEKAATETLGVAPTRFGRGSRRLLVYAGKGLFKRRVAFRRCAGQLVNSGDPDLSSDAKGNGETADVAESNGREVPVQAVELLATGQQYVVEGIHPKTGKPYFWKDDRRLSDVDPDALTLIDGARLDSFFDQLEGLVGLYGYEVVSRSSLSASDGQVWQGGLAAPSLDAVKRAMAAVPNDVDYDTWLKIGAAIKASCGPELEPEAYELFEDWSLQWPENTPEAVMAKWQSLHPPFKVGWDFLSRFATEEGDGTFYSAWEDFDAVALATPEAHTRAVEEAQPLTAMFKRYVWVERLQRICDMESGDLLNREMFNIRNWHIGDPTSTKDCAYAQFTRDGSRRLSVKAVTFRPGGTKFVREHLPGLEGLCINRWNDPSPNLPVTATDDEVAPWLDHVAFVIPDERERNVVLNWLAWIIQNPGEKPNWALVIGSTVEGMGKDLMLEPVRHALGHGNVREIGPDDLVSGYTDFLAGTRLLLVEEMQMSERKAMQNRLKPLIAAPPYTLRVNIKFESQFEIPNLVASIFFTNMDNALAMSKGDRRFFVTWNDSQPRSAEYYEGLLDWYQAGGAVKAARWLLDRDVFQFKAKGRAPETAAKEQMRRASLPEADGLIADAMDYRDPPFHRRFARLADVIWFVNSQTDGFRRVTPQQVVRKLKAAGALSLGRVCLGKAAKGIQEPPDHNWKQTHLFALPGDTAAMELLNDISALRDAYWSDWKTGLETEAREAADDIFS